MAIPKDGEGVLLSGKGDLARGDLVSAPINVKPFHWVRVTVEYVVESGDPALFVCLRPTSDPSLVDLAFLPKESPGERRTGTRRAGKCIRYDPIVVPPDCVVSKIFSVAAIFLATIRGSR